jgi:hypothetical protein
MKRSAGNYIVADVVENFDEAVAGARGAEEGSPAITAERDEVEIAASIKALQTVAHGKVWDNAKSKTAPLKGTRDAAPTLTSATYRG